MSYDSIRHYFASSELSEGRTYCISQKNSTGFKRYLSQRRKGRQVLIDLNFETISNNQNAKQKHQPVYLKRHESLSLREMPERLLKVLNIKNLKFWYCLGFRASHLGFSLKGVFGAIHNVEVVLVKI